MPLGILVVLAKLTNYEIHNTCIYLYLTILVAYNHHCMMYYIRLCNVEYSQGSHSYNFEGVQLFKRVHGATEIPTATHFESAE